MNDLEGRIKFCFNWFVELKKKQYGGCIKSIRVLVTKNNHWDKSLVREKSEV
jgi:hypothetical protein